MICLSVWNKATELINNEFQLSMSIALPSSARHKVQLRFCTLANVIASAWEVYCYAAFSEQAIGAHRFVIRQGSHSVYTIGLQMTLRLSGLRSGRSLLPWKIPGTHFCYRLSQSQGHNAAGRSRPIEKSNDLIGNQTNDRPACSIRWRNRNF
jgi:hypothetical protein